MLHSVVSPERTRGGVPSRPIPARFAAIWAARATAALAAAEELLLADGPLQRAAAAWLLLFALGVHAAS